METINFILELANLIAIIIGFYFTARELKESREQREQERKSIRLQNSIDCSKDFADLINNELSFINNCLSTPEYEEMINRFKYEDLNLFDKKEYSKLVENDVWIKEYLKRNSESNYAEKSFSNIVESYIISVDPPSEEYTLIRSLEASKWSLTDEEDKFLKETIFNKITDKTILNKYLTLNKKARDIIYYKQKINTYYHNQLIALLNKLEYFAMTFNTNLADEKIVYPSLHQSFLKIVKYMYPHICNLNSGESADKYYTQIIELYNLWKGRYIKDLKKTQEQEENIRKRTVDENSKF